MTRQCRICAKATCATGRCRKFKDIIKKWMSEYGYSYDEAAKKIGNFCPDCSEPGGHPDGKICELREKNIKYCSNCDKFGHSCKKNIYCPYWSGLALLTLFFNDRWIRNKTTDGKRWVCEQGNMNAHWDIKDFKINLDKIKSKSKLYFYNTKIIRQYNLVKLLLLDNNFYGNDENKLNIAKEIHGETIYNEIVNDNKIDHNNPNFSWSTVKKNKSKRIQYH